MNQLQDDIAIAIMHGPEDGTPMPIVETTKEVLEHYNKNNLEGLKAAGYFILRDVIVCETGQRDAIKARLQKGAKDSF